MLAEPDPKGPYVLAPGGLAITYVWRGYDVLLPNCADTRLLVIFTRVVGPE